MVLFYPTSTISIQSPQNNSFLDRLSNFSPESGIARSHIYKENKCLEWSYSYLSFSVSHDLLSQLSHDRGHRGPRCVVLGARSSVLAPRFVWSELKWSCWRNKKLLDTKPLLGSSPSIIQGGQGPKKGAKKSRLYYLKNLTVWEVLVVFVQLLKLKIHLPWYSRAHLSTCIRVRTFYK